MRLERGDEQAWAQQRRAQSRLSLEDRIRQNDSLCRLWAGEPGSQAPIPRPPWVTAAGT
ncbi:MAG: hypothetical protein ACT4OS_00460 [Acidimicrobiales bacterium]